MCYSSYKKMHYKSFLIVSVVSKKHSGELKKKKNQQVSYLYLYIYIFHITCK